MYETFFETINVYKIGEDSNLGQLKEQIASEGLRPELPNREDHDLVFTNQEKAYLSLIQQCWKQEQQERLTFGEIYHSLMALFQK
jgi:hypothetical protein